MEHGATTGADQRQGAFRLVRLSAEDMRRDTGLHVHQCDVVCDHVVQLMRDPQPFFDHPPLCLFVPRLLGPHGTLLQLQQIRAPVPDRFPDRAREQHEERQTEVVEDVPPTNSTSAVKLSSAVATTAIERVGRSFARTTVYAATPM